MCPTAEECVDEPAAVLGGWALSACAPRTLVALLRTTISFRRVVHNNSRPSLRIIHEVSFPSDRGAFTRLRVSQGSREQQPADREPSVAPEELALTVLCIGQSV
jgi:hypothetical protein